MRTLSKSDFKVGLSCPTKLYYREAGGYPSTLDDDPYLAMLAEGGYMVEQLAKARYPTGRLQAYGGESELAAEATLEALRQDHVVLFEATLLLGRRLARVDILDKRGNDIRLIEVKAKSWDSAANRERLDRGQRSAFWRARGAPALLAEWEEYLADVTFQVLLLESVLPEVRVHPFLCLVDKHARCTIDGLPDWFTLSREARPDGRSRLVTATLTGDPSRAVAEGLTVEIPVHEEVEFLRAAVGQLSQDLLASYEPELHRLPPKLTVQCRDCEYRLPRAKEAGAARSGFGDCWQELADVYPSVLDIYHIAALEQADSAIARRQALQLRHTLAGTSYCSAELGRLVRSVVYPLHFIDFEVGRMAIPHHAGMRPYGPVAFQWSCHTQERPGGPLAHSGWLNANRDWPNPEFARTLRDAIQDGGTVLTWSPFEQSILREVARELRAFCPGEVDLIAWIDRLAPQDKGATHRVVDQYKLTLEHFFHPGMNGRASIKVVLDSLWKADEAMRDQFKQFTGRAGDPALGPYASLPPLVIAGVVQRVAEGTGALRAYEALMFGAERDNADVQESWRRLLEQYCELDTLAMVLIWEHWRRCTEQYV
ncbi:MAG: DUF2779 domain-containing protein [Gemmatimonadetes bacterium]|nr:DUF2779 domain-containing protein [Gemmatimonadota bacterium]